jgi:hypothetical protein
MKSFASYTEAKTWMESEVDDTCIDNYRFAYSGDVNGVKNYERQRSKGCCGSFDISIKVKGRIAFIGCNYGH